MKLLIVCIFAVLGLSSASLRRSRSLMPEEFGSKGGPVPHALYRRSAEQISRDYSSQRGEIKNPLSPEKTLKCGEGEYIYSTNCGPLTLEPSCQREHTKRINAHLCDYHACYCSPPTVRDLDSNKCMTRDKCPKTDFQLHKEYPALY